MHLKTRSKLDINTLREKRELIGKVVISSLSLIRTTQFDAYDTGNKKKFLILLADCFPTEHREYCAVFLKLYFPVWPSA